MWNCPTKAIPREHLLRNALEALERVQAAMLCEDFLPDYEEALRVIRKHGCLEERYLKRFEIALRDPRLSPDMRYEATGQAIRLMRRQLGSLFS